MNEKEKITNYETLKHIERVRNILNIIIIELIKRGENHDQTKLKSPEVELIAEHTDKLANCTYGSDEYNKNKEALGPALEHHYANNRHHPEFHNNGIDSMNIVDIVEMLADWQAASERHNDGNLAKSIKINQERFNMSEQLVKIFSNSVDILKKGTICEK